MKVAFFSETGNNTRYPRNFPNARTDVSWCIALDAPMCSLSVKPNEHFDLGIVIIPKNNPKISLDFIRGCCDKVGIMQEGPNWYWQDYSMENQIWYYNMLIDADFILVHNKSDINYYKGLTNKKKVFPMHSLMITDGIVPRNQWGDVVIIGGNMCSWYGGFDSYIVAQEFDMPIYAPSMGRKIEQEEELENLRHMEYMNWREWIDHLSEFHVGVHLMRTHAAGTFALNCAFHGIPCIGYEGLDTQETLHQHLSVKLGDLDKAKRLVTELKNDDGFFYKMCSTSSQEMFKKFYSEEEWLNRWEYISRMICEEG